MGHVLWRDGDWNRISVGRHHSRKSAHMSHALQLIVCVGIAIAIALISLVIDKWEHSRQVNQERTEQESFYFPEQPAQEDHDRTRKGAAMSRLS